MDNKEDLLRALEEFEEKSTPNDPIPELLENYLLKVAHTGETIFEWDKLKSLFLHKLNVTMLDFSAKFPSDHLVPSPNVENVKFEEMKNRILDTAAQFTGAPFTIQRLCELLTSPHSHYKRTDKFLRGLEKNLNVVSSVDPLGNKIVSEPKALYNGMDSNGMETGEIRTPEKVNSPFLPPPPPTNSPVASSLFSSVSGMLSSASPSPLLQSWPREGSSEATAFTSTGQSDASQVLPSSSDQSKSAESYEEYMPPEKKARVDSSEMLMNSEGSASEGSTDPSPMPSMSEVFSMTLRQDSDSASPSCQPLSSVTSDSQVSGSLATQEVAQSTSSQEPSVSQSQNLPSVCEPVPSMEESPSSALSETPQEAVATEPVVSNSDTLEGSNMEQEQNATENTENVSLSDVVETSEVGALQEDATEDLSETVGEREPIEQIQPQPVEDGTDRRDSQGFDVSPNPEESGAVSSDSSSDPSELCQSTDGPESEVSSSLAPSSPESVSSTDAAVPSLTDIPVYDGVKSSPTPPISQEDPSGATSSSQESECSSLPTSSSPENDIAMDTSEALADTDIDAQPNSETSPCQEPATDNLTKESTDESSVTDELTGTVLGVDSTTDSTTTASTDSSVTATDQSTEDMNTS